MQRKRNGLLPAAEVLSGLGGPVKAIREASPQALHHFTQADQVNQLVSASEADADLGFMARMMVLWLPRTNPGNRHRMSGAITLAHHVLGETSFPSETSRASDLAWVCTEAVRIQSRELVARPLARTVHEDLGRRHLRSG